MRKASQLLYSLWASGGIIAGGILAAIAGSAGIFLPHFALWTIISYNIIA
jgi:hypothetical protein